ncbi:MAG TPA: 2'-5' RNA ligase family protein [Candidatus Limnocylindrales bacterium]|nr:2'-5' RNA ligase family protein [Candidatus Limnocylindrales bacterium]
MVSALVVPVDLPRRLELVRRARVASAALGVPAHITLLFPFKGSDELREADRRRIAAILRATGPIPFRLATARHWDDVRYLAVEPGEPFTRLVERLVAAYPTWTPYGGAFPYVPHVTISEGAPGEHPAIADPRRPLERIADRALLIEEGDDGRWRTRWRFHMGRG